MRYAGAAHHFSGGFGGYGAGVLGYDDLENYHTSGEEKAAAAGIQ